MIMKRSKQHSSDDLDGPFVFLSRILMESEQCSKFGTRASVQAHTTVSPYRCVHGAALRIRLVFGASRRRFYFIIRRGQVLWRTFVRHIISFGLRRPLRHSLCFGNLEEKDCAAGQRFSVTPPHSTRISNKQKDHMCYSFFSNFKMMSVSCMLIILAGCFVGNIAIDSSLLMTNESQSISNFESMIIRIGRFRAIYRPVAYTDATR